MIRDDGVADWAASGVIPLTGRPCETPLVPPGRAASVARELAERFRGIGVQIDGAALLGERAALTRWTRRGAVSLGGGCRLLPTVDGWAAVSLVRPDDRPLLGALVGQELADDPWPQLSRWLRERSGEELATGAAMLGVAAAPVRDPFAAPRASGSPGTPARPGGLREAAGLLVVDFSALWAGPLCAHLLGMAGARVVKVETPSRPDGARHGNPAFYRLLHSGHRSVVLDPATPGGRSAMADLVAAADVVIEASRPRALAGFGIAAADFVAAGAIWVSITAAGRANPRIGFGDDVAAGAGLVAHDQAGPVFCGDAIADPLTGLTAAVGALSAPRGTLVDVAMDAVVANTFPPAAGEEKRPAGTGDDGYRVTPARRDSAGEAWSIGADDGPVPVRPPRARPIPPAPAPASGDDTATVFAELGLPAP